MDRNALQARCESRFRDTSNETVSDANWADYINDAYMDVLASSPFWPFLETRNTSVSVTGGAGGLGAADLTFDVLKVTAVYNATDDFALTPIDGAAAYRAYFPDPATNLSTPTHYRLRGKTLEVYPWPVNTTTLEVDYRIAGAALGATDEPAFPEQYHRALVSGALAFAYEDDGNLEQANTHRARFDRIVDRMLDDLLGARTEQYPTITDVWA